MEYSILRRIIILLMGVFCYLPISFLWAASYSLPSMDEALIGEVQHTSVQSNEALVNIASRYDLGMNEVKNANPGIDPGRYLPTGALLTIPSAYLLPPGVRTGMVINLPEMRLYYYPTDLHVVMTYPIGIGKVGKMIPMTRTYVVRKAKNPSWRPPQDIRDFNTEQGIVLPDIMPPGPDNPLGPYAIYLGVPTYLVHSTIFPDSVGKRASFGCIRMREDDIKNIFSLVERRTPVAIINMPVKTGWQGGRLYLEAHPPLEDYPASTDTLGGMVNLMQANTHRTGLVFIDWQMVSYLNHERDGIPHEVGVRLVKS